jgi:large subunit ribosomal protein L7A
MVSPSSNEKIVIGYKQVLKAVKNNLCKRIFIAEDCSPSMSDAILSVSCNIPIDRVPSMRELGKECGIDVSASCAAIIRL